MIEKELNIPNNSENLFGARQFIRTFLDECPIEKSETNRVILAVDEALANIVEHAEEVAQHSEIEISLKLMASDTEFEVVIRDTAVKFDPTGVGEVDLDEHIRAGKKGGLGVFLMRQIMDKVAYTYEEGKMNELKLVKYFKKGLDNE